MTLYCYNMSIIYTLDDYNPTNTEQRIRLKKKYNITLLNLLPLVLECIIQDYIHDIIEVKISRINAYYMRVSIINQYINYNSISCSYMYYINNQNAVITDVIIDSHIADVIRDWNLYNSWTLVLNKYMKYHYNKSWYLGNKLVQGTYYKHDTIITSYHNNKLTCKSGEEVHEIIKINDHKLFKNMIVIMKCLMKKIDIT